MKNKIQKDSFITEIEEDLKNDNLKKLWDKYGIYLITAMASILLITIVIEIYSYIKIKSNENTTNTYVTATNLEKTNNTEVATQILDQLSKKDNFVKDLSQLKEVNILTKSNKEEAIAKLENIISNKKTAPQIKDVAIIILASHKVDTDSLENVEKTLSPLLTTSNQWYYNAKEFIAIAQLKANKKQDAIATFEEIYNNTNTETLKNRVSDVLSILK